MFIAILGRQPEISVAELESVFGKKNISTYRDIATVDTASLDINRLGGTIKSGQIIKQVPLIDAQKDNFKPVADFITKYYRELWKNSDHKITLGLSTYQLDISPRDIQKIGLQLKVQLKKDGVNLRLVPNDSSALSTASSHNNKLGLSLNKVELIIAKTSPYEVVIAESRGAQNITAYTKRDHEKPYRDAFVGMLPPKLAQIMINLAHVENGFILDPFCGTGTVLQEALLLGYDTYGTDFSTKMIDYSTKNLTWLKQKYPRLAEHKIRLEEADAIDHKWDNPHQISAVVSEVYLGQPFSAPPSPEKLEQVRRQCNHITSSFLENIRPQLASSTILCLAVPAWLNKDGSFTYLPLVRNLEKLGYQLADHRPLLYHRENQVVARQLLVLSIK